MHSVAGSLSAESRSEGGDPMLMLSSDSFFFFQAEDGIRDLTVTGVQTCALPISFNRRQPRRRSRPWYTSVGNRTCVLMRCAPVCVGGPEVVYDRRIAAAICDGQIGRASCRERV